MYLFTAAAAATTAAAAERAQAGVGGRARRHAPHTPPSGDDLLHSIECFLISRTNGIFSYWADRIYTIN